MESITTSCNKKLKMFFFPYIAGGHLLPSINLARVFASHPDVQVTIIATQKNVQLFQKAIDQDRQVGHDIEFHTIEIPNKSELGGVENFLEASSMELRLKLFKAIMGLKGPLLELLREHRPDCLVSDIMYPWTLEIANEVDIPRLVFHTTSLFMLCVDDCLIRFEPHEKVGSDTEPFALPGLHEQAVKLTRLQLPHWHTRQTPFTSFFKSMQESTRKSFGVIVNSCIEFELAHYDYCKNVSGTRVWLAGPVNQYPFMHNHISGLKTAEKERYILEWLDTKEANSVTYVCFGSEGPPCKEQLYETAHGLIDSGQPFILAVHSSGWDQGEEGRLLDEQIAESKQGLIIKGWAPQMRILKHDNVGAFMTHCGWNSTMESLSIGVPMITWPLSVDQFCNECLVVDVLKVGIRVGSAKDVHTDLTPKVTVTRDKVEPAVRHMMSGVEEVQEMRTRVKQYANKSKLAVQVGGSSYNDVFAIVEELKQRIK